MKRTMKAGIGQINLSVGLFRRDARDYFRAYLNFRRGAGEFSPVPFFLCCRAIELALKAKHLEKEITE
jgi:hypothetical protein